MKAGRNDPCPCGSGKKFKKCCAMARSQKPLKASIISSGISNKMSSVFQKGISRNQEKEEVKVSMKNKISLPSQAIKPGN